MSLHNNSLNNFNRLAALYRVTFVSPTAAKYTDNIVKVKESGITGRLRTNKQQECLTGMRSENGSNPPEKRLSLPEGYFQHG